MDKKRKRPPPRVVEGEVLSVTPLDGPNAGQTRGPRMAPSPVVERVQARAPEARAPVRVAGAPEARRAPAVSIAACGICGSRVKQKDMGRIRVGPIYVGACRRCLRPVVHGMGLLAWITGG